MGDSGVSETTILYTTDSVLDPVVAERCRHNIMEVSGGRRIVSVSQEPLDWGDNICVGKLERVAVSIDTQILIGLEAVDTPYVALAEHDCLYTEEHFDFVPPDNTHFWYNDNCWLVQYRCVDHPEYDGMYSYFPDRRAQSQLICGTDSFRESEVEKLAILSHPNWFEKYPRGRIGEPGANVLKRTRRLYRGLLRDPDIVQHKELGMLWKRIKRYITTYNAEEWKSVSPNLDIRHGQNFTGQRRGRRRTWDLPPWGNFETVMNGGG